MQYFGGKQRTCKQITNYLNRLENLDYLEPFVGGASIISLINSERERERVGSDINTSLIMLLNEIRDGVFDYPNYIDEDTYNKYKNDSNDSAMKAFIGFGCSFAGKWYGGYARRSKGDNESYNFAAAAKNSLIRKSKGFNNCKFICQDYRNIKPQNKLIYCDPPL